MPEICYNLSRAAGPFKTDCGVAYKPHAQSHHSRDYIKQFSQLGIYPVKPNLQPPGDPSAGPAVVPVVRKLTRSQLRFSREVAIELAYFCSKAVNVQLCARTPPIRVLDSAAFTNLPNVRETLGSGRAQEMLHDRGTFCRHEFRACLGSHES